MPITLPDDPLTATLIPGLDVTSKPVITSYGSLAGPPAILSSSTGDKPDWSKLVTVSSASDPWVKTSSKSLTEQFADLVNTQSQLINDIQFLSDKLEDYPVIQDTIASLSKGLSVLTERFEQFDSEFSIVNKLASDFKQLIAVLHETSKSSVLSGEVRLDLLSAALNAKGLFK